MKLTADADPDFVTTPPRKHRRPRILGLLLFLALAAAVALYSVSATLAPSRAIAQTQSPVFKPVTLTTQQPDPNMPLRAAIPDPADHFVVTASPLIDPEMVHPAPAGIDEAMVVTPRP